MTGRGLGNSLRNPYNVGDTIVVPANSWCTKTSHENGVWRNDSYALKSEMSVEVLKAFAGSVTAHGMKQITTPPRVQFLDEDDFLCKVDVDDALFIYNEDLRIANEHP